jgi:hypothetical protein
MKEQSKTECFEVNMKINMLPNARPFYFSAATFQQYWSEEEKIAVCYKSRMQFATSEPTWWLPSSPVLEEKTCDFLMDIEKVPKPFVVTLQLFGNTKSKSTWLWILKTEKNIAASEPTWRLPSSAVVG